MTMTGSRYWRNGLLATNSACVGIASAMMLSSLRAINAETAIMPIPTKKPINEMNFESPFETRENNGVRAVTPPAIKR